MSYDLLVTKLHEKFPEDLKDKISPEKTGFFLLLALYVIGVIVFLFAGVFPLLNQTREYRRESRALEENIVLVHRRIKNLDDIRDELAQLERVWDRLERALPREREIPQFLGELANLARDSQVKIESIAPAPVKREDPGEAEMAAHYKPVMVEMNARSGFHQLGSFIAALESGERLVAIREIRIRQDRNTPQMHSIYILVETYVAIGG